MDIEDLRTLCIVVKEGSVTRAAQKLCRVPSAVSSRLRTLETEFGTVLFLRQNRRMIPTAEGLTLAQEASRLVDEADQLAARFRRQAPGGLLRIGTLDSIAGARLPGPLAELLSRWPALAPSVTVGVSQDLVTNLRKRMLDAALLVDAPSSEEFCRRPVYEETLCLAMPASQSPVVRPQELKKHCVIAYPAGCSYRDRLLQWFAQSGSAPERLIEVSSYSAILASVAAGMGVAAVPKNIAQSSAQSGAITLQPLPEPLSVAVVELVWPAGGLTANVKALDAVLPNL